MKAHKQREIEDQDEVYSVLIRRDRVTGVAISETWYRERDLPEQFKRDFPHLPPTTARFHRIGGPAGTRRDPSTGVVIDEEWYRDGLLHREDGPAIIRRSPDGKIKYTSWYRDGELIPYRQRPKTPDRAKASIPRPTAG